jgi:hypothetical protein
LEEFKEFRSSGVQEFRSSGVQEFRSSGVQGGVDRRIARKNAFCDRNVGIGPNVFTASS